MLLKVVLVHPIHTPLQPNKCSGKLKQSAVHLAARHNLEEVMVALLRYGGDVEIRDALLHQPLALTTNYEIR